MLESIQIPTQYSNDSQETLTLKLKARIYELERYVEELEIQLNYLENNFHKEGE